MILTDASLGVPAASSFTVKPMVSLQEAVDGAAKEGHLEVVIWLSTNTNAGATKAAMVRKIVDVLLVPVFLQKCVWHESNHSC